MKKSLLMTGVVKVIVMFVVVVLAAAASHYLTLANLQRSAVQNEPADAEKKPLYWVAPMNPDYRRDEPGKSPMGMDLVPVYAEQQAAAADVAGTVLIAPEVENNLGVRTGVAERRRMHTEITTVGYVQYDEDRLVHVHPRVEGWIEKLYVKAAGDPVAKGQPLYELYSPQLVNAQEELVLAVTRQNARLISAAEARLQALQIDAALIERLKRDRQVRQTLTFYAPQSGVVDNLNIREGFFVKPGTTLMSVGTLDSVWVEAEVFERQATLVEVGLPVTMTLDYLPGQSWQGQVNYVYPTLDPQTRTARLRLRFANPERLLKPNMFAQVTIHAQAQDAVLAVPRQALIRTGDQDRVVRALGDGRFRSVAVQPGRMDENFVEIREGLTEGERVVVSAQFLLDSESSKTADLRRMDQSETKPDPHSGHAGHAGESSHD